MTTEAAWATQPLVRDVQAFLVGHLTTSAATEAPLVVYGQPGSGKSSLSLILAARLGGPSFVPLVVPLRDVPADAHVQDQIDRGLALATGDSSFTWVALVESAPGAVPVVFLDGLDGLDELVQASGRERADYLEEVRRFQQDTSDRGRPVTVIVTSRLSTVHRVRVPPEAVVARLEPFDPVHVRRWVDLWNRMSPGEPLLTPIWCSVTRSSSGSRCCSSSSPCTTVAQGCVT